MNRDDYEGTPVELLEQEARCADDSFDRLYAAWKQTEEQARAESLADLLSAVEGQRGVEKVASEYLLRGLRNRARVQYGSVAALIALRKLMYAIAVDVGECQPRDGQESLVQSLSEWRSCAAASRVHVAAMLMESIQKQIDRYRDSAPTWHAFPRQMAHFERCAEALDAALDVVSMLAREADAQVPEVVLAQYPDLNDIKAVLAVRDAAAVSWKVVPGIPGTVAAPVAEKGTR